MSDRLTPEREAEIAARKAIADLLWWSVPGSTDEEAKARTEQLLDTYAEAVRAESATENARLDRKVASLKQQQEQDDAEYAEALAERDRALKLVAELEAVRAERDCLAMAVLFARQWGEGTPFELHAGIDEILATMPSAGAGEAG